MDMWVDVIVVRDQKQVRELNRISTDLLMNALNGLLKGYCESPEDYIAVRPSKRQVGGE